MSIWGVFCGGVWLWWWGVDFLLQLVVNVLHVLVLVLPHQFQDSVVRDECWDSSSLNVNQIELGALCDGNHILGNVMEHERKIFLQQDHILRYD